MQKQTTILLLSVVSILNSALGGEVPKDLLINKLQLYDACLSRLSCNYAYKVEALSGYEAFAEQDIQKLRKAYPNRPNLGALPKSAVEGEEVVELQRYGNITKRIVRDSRKMGDGNYQYITDGAQTVIYDLDVGNARIMTSDPFITFLPFDRAIDRITREHLYPRKDDFSIADFLKVATDSKVSSQGSNLVYELTLFRKENPSRYDRLTLFVATKPDITISKYILSFGILKNGQAIDHPASEAHFSDFQQIQPGIWIPFSAIWSETSYTGPVDKTIAYPNLRHTLTISKIYDYDIKKDGDIKLEVPAGTRLSDDISGTTYNLLKTQMLPSDPKHK